MYNAEDIQDSIDAYLRGELSSSDARAFEQELASNPSLREQLGTTERLNNLVIENRLLRVKGLAKTEEAKLRRNKKFTKTGIVVTLALIMAGTGAYLISKNDKEIVPVTTERAEEISEKSVNPIISNSSSEGSTAPIISKHQEKNAQANSSSQPSDTPEEPKIRTHEKPASDSVIIPKDTLLVKKDGMRTKREDEVLLAKGIVEKEAVAAIPCSEKSIVTDYLLQASCDNENNGEIKIKSTSGGSAPYAHTVYDQYNTPVSTLYNLESGYYTLVVEDSAGCKSNYSIQIKKRICNTNFDFNPENGESWEIPTSFKSGEITIYDKNGQLVYNFELEDDVQNSWDGTDQNGEMVQPGYYIFIMKYDNGDQLKGSITITQ